MFLGLEWYWWLALLGALALSIPLKIKFMKGWAKRQQAQQGRSYDQWGDEV